MNLIETYALALIGPDGNASIIAKTTTTNIYDITALFELTKQVKLTDHHIAVVQLEIKSVL